jgi:hypothetical protein
VLDRLFCAFAQYLQARPRSDNPQKDLESLGSAYLR